MNYDNWKCHVIWAQQTNEKLLLLFTFLLSKYRKNWLLFYFYLSKFLGITFYLYLSNFLATYLYFYLSTENHYLLQHWLKLMQ